MEHNISSAAAVAGWSADGGETNLAQVGVILVENLLVNGND